MEEPKKKGVQPGTVRGKYRKRKKKKNRVVKETPEVTPEIKPDMNEEKEPEIKTTEVDNTTTEEITVEETHTEETVKSDVQPTQNLTGADRFTQFQNEYEEVKTEVKTTETTTEEKTPESKTSEVVVVKQKPNTNQVIVTGRMLIMFCDLLFPALIKKFMKLIGDEKAKSVKSADMRLDEDQREEIEPLCDEIAEEIFKNMPPLVAFAIYMASCYYINYQVQRDLV